MGALFGGQLVAGQQAGDALHGAGAVEDVVEEGALQGFAPLLARDVAQRIALPAATHLRQRPGLHGILGREGAVIALALQPALPRGGAALLAHTHRLCQAAVTTRLAGAAARLEHDTADRVGQGDKRGLHNLGTAVPAVSGWDTGGNEMADTWLIKP